MPVFMVTAPDGRKLRITAPEGATEQDAIAYAQKQMANLPPAAPSAPLGATAASGTADASALAKPPTGEFDPRTSGASFPEALSAFMAGNPATAPIALGTAAGAMAAGGKPAVAAAQPVRRAAGNALSLLSNDEGDQAAVAAAAVPGARVIEHPLYGKIVMLPDGTTEWLNKPGITPRSVESAAAQVVPFLGGPAGRAGAGLAARAGMGAVRGALGGAGRETAEAALRPTVGASTDAATTAGDIGFDAATGGAGEALIGPLMRLGANAIRKLKGVDTWSKASVASALKGENLPADTIDAVWRAGAQGQDPMAVLRLVEARQIGNPLTPGQVMKDDSQMAQLRTLLAQSGDQAPGSHMARQALEGQDAALTTEAQRIRDAAGIDTSRTGGAAGTSVLEPIDAKVAAERARYQALFGKVPDDAVINAQTFTRRDFSPDGKAVVDNIVGLMAQNRTAAPTVTRILKGFLNDFVKSGKPVGLRDFDAVRRQLGEATNLQGPESGAAKAAYSLFNNMEEFASQTGNVYSASGGNAASALRDARVARKTFGQRFEGEIDTPTGGTTPDMVSRLASGGVQPQNVMDEILGAGGKLDVRRRGFTEGLDRLAQQSPESFAAVRLEAVHRAVEKVMTAGSDEALDKTLKSLSADKQFLGSLIDDSQFNTIFRLARQRRAALAGRTGSKAPLPSKDLIAKLGTAVSLGTLTGLGAAPIVGPGVAFGAALTAGGALARTAKQRAEASLARRLTLPPDRLRLPANGSEIDTRLLPGILNALQNRDEQ